ncbi:MAG: sarcosine oxidase subunit gamma family protein [Pseudomonadota bacterium]
MAEFTLEAKPVLGGFTKDWSGTTLTELTNLAAVAVSVPAGGEKKLSAALKKSYGDGVPAVGESYVSKDGARVVGFAQDQMMVLWDHPPHGGVATVSGQLGDTGYFVEQTSNWVFLELSGPLSRASLERLSALNLHPDVYPVDRAERTIMEHMGALVVRTGEDTFLLASASSSARSFAHAVETSLDWVS